LPYLVLYIFRVYYKGIIITVLVSFIYQTGRLCGQEASSSVFMPPNVSFENFLIDNGDASQSTISLCQDSRGLLWFGTETGLYSFDGIRYKVYPVIGSGDIGIYGYHVLSIFEDSERNIWAGTSSALNKLDFKTGRFKHYYPDTTGGSGRNIFIRLIAEDSRGILWLVTSRKVFSFDRKTSTFREFRIDSLDQDINLYVAQNKNALIEDQNGRIWILYGEGIYVYDPKNDSFRNFFKETAKQVSGVFSGECIAADQYGKIWVASRMAGLIRITDPEDGKFEILQFKIENYGKGRNILSSCSAIHKDKEGLIWVSGLRGVARIDPGRMIIENFYIPENAENNGRPFRSFNFDKIFETADGNIWFVEYGSGRIVRLDPDRHLFSFYTVPEKKVNQCILDRTDAFWFGCPMNNNWRMRTGPLPYYYIKVDNERTTEQYRKLLLSEDNNGKLWMVLSSGVYKIDHFSIDSTFKIIKTEIPTLIKNRYPGIESDDKITSVYKDKNGVLWFGTDGGYVIREEDGVYTRIKTAQYGQFFGSRIFVIDEDSEGNLYFGSNNQYMQLDGIYRMNAGSSEIKLILYYYDLSGVGSDYGLTDLIVGRKNEVWVTTVSGLFRIEYDKLKDNVSVTTISKTEPWSGNIYYRLEREDNGTIWLLTSLNGLYTYNEVSQKLVHVNLEEHDRQIKYLDLQVSGNGLVYIAHNRGITEYDPFSGNTKEIRTHKNPVSSQSCKLRNGLIAFLFDNDLLFFNDSVQLNHQIPPVILTRLLVNDLDYNNVFPKSKEDINSVRELNLRHSLNSVSFEFSALNFTDSKYNSYRYFMKGVDDDTVSSGPINYVSYKKLRRGNYTFWATGSNNDGLWNKSGIEIKIFVKPPFYGSTIAVLIYILSTVILIRIYVNWRTSRINEENIRLESEVNIRTRELEVKNNQLEEINMVKNRFFTDISHEIRTPLSLILGPLDSMLSENQYDRKISTLLEIMKRSGQRLMQLVTQMLDISRLDSGKMIINLSETDITGFLKILIYEFVSMAESRKIRYLVELPDKPHIVYFDRDKTEKIITNLLSNAFKFTPAEGIICCKVNIRNDYTGYGHPSLLVTVSDSGPGIDSKNIEKIFDRFYRIEGQYDSLSTGTGIGLSLTKELVTLLHGKIDVVSEKEKGSVFEVEFPIGKDHLKDDEYVILESRHSEKGEMEISNLSESNFLTLDYHDHGRYRILVIEDNSDLRRFISVSLEDEYEVSAAENGKIGYNLGIGIIPDIIITDIMMDGIDGLTLCKKFRDDERTSHIPIIILTAKATDEDKITGLETGADDYLTKPFNLVELKVRISNLLLQRERLKIRYMGAGAFQVNDPDEESVDDKFMKKVNAIINEKMADFDFDVRALQEELGMSRMHLFRKLKVLTGIAPVVYIRNKRLERAAQMLAHKTGNVTEIANSVGISNPSYFAKCFRDNFGMSPKDYNNNGRANGIGNNLN